jgi:hypothetical protein
MTKIMLVTGAGGSLGIAYIKACPEGFVPYGITHSSNGHENTLPADLTDSVQTREAVSRLPDDTQEFIVIHAVGEFKFERNSRPAIDQNCDGIDDDVYASNVSTFTNLYDALTARFPKVKISFAVFGSVSDRYELPFWPSFWNSKNKLRDELRRRVTERSPYAPTRGVVLNVPTVNTGNERRLRPHKGPNHWMRPADLVEETLPLLQNGPLFIEADILPPDAGFSWDYYSSPERVLAKWTRAMKGQ